MTKRTWIAGVLLLVVTLAAFAALYPSITNVEVRSPRAGPMSGDHIEWEEKGFALLEQETGHRVRDANGLRFYYRWPQQKWLSVFAPSPGSAELAIITATYEPFALDLKIYRFRRQEYDGFLREFDAASSGYRFMRQGFDGKAFSYERWRQGSAVSYSGNASLSSKDAEVYQIVDGLVANVSRSQPLAHKPVGQ